jgi:DNA-binding XRE family transcriptional regulator
MPSYPLSNYLKMHRRRSGFFQDEVSFLLGAEGGAEVCRHERCRRVPTLETALAYEAIFGVPVRELFAGVYRKAEKEVKRRAGRLARRLHRANPSRLTERKAEALRAICFGSPDCSTPNHDPAQTK